MTVFWLIAWLLSSTPELHQWNNWAIALVVCLILDFFGAMKAS